MKRFIRLLQSWIETDGWLVGVAIAGTLVRLGLIAWTRKNASFYDELDYEQIGNSISHGLGFKNLTVFTAYRAPGQPLLVGTIFAAAGHHLLYVKVFEALLLAMLPFVCAKIGRAIGLTPLAANLGATLAAFHPALAYASTTIYPTVLTTCALTLGIWLCWKSMQLNRVGWAVGAGVALGIAGAATTTFAPLAFLTALVMAWKRHFRLAVVVAVIGTAPAVAWMIRNEMVMGTFTLATNGGQNLELGANDEATPRSGNWLETSGDVSKGEVYVDHQLQQQAKAWIQTHHWRYMTLAGERAVVVFDSVGNPKTQGLHSGTLAKIAGYALLPVMLFGLLGLALYLRTSLAWLTIAALFLVVASSAATIAKPRFRFPCDPLIGVFAVAGAVKVKERFGAESEAGRP